MICRQVIAGLVGVFYAGAQTIQHLLQPFDFLHRCASFEAALDLTFTPCEVAQMAGRLDRSQRVQQLDVAIQPLAP